MGLGLRARSLALLAPLALAACGAMPMAGQPTTAGAPSLVGTTWELVQVQSMDDAQGSIRLPDPSLYTLHFGADGRVALRLNCNRAMGPFQVQVSTDGRSGSLRFGPLAGTRAMCPSPSMDEKLLRDLADVRSYLVRDGQLHLSLMADGGIYS
jgi:heat shock protein HslJ